MTKTLILKDNIMSLDGSYIWVSKGSAFKYFPETEQYEAHYACGTYIIKCKHLNLNDFE